MLFCNTSPNLVPNKTKQQVNRRALPNLRNQTPGGSGDTVVKRMTLASQVVTSTAAGLIAVTTRSASEVQSAPAAEWASFAARYQQYRVRRLRIIAKATHPADEDPVSGVAHHSALYLADHIGTSAPATAAQVLSDEAGRVIATYKDFMYEATWARNPNAKLWAPTSAVTPAANDYSISFASATAPALLASDPVFAYVLEWEVEFRGS